MDKIILAFELIGTVSFSISGAICATKKNLDVFGTLFCAIITALGGGVFRDTLLGILPPMMFTNYIYLLVASVVAMLTLITVLIINKTKIKFIENASITFLNHILDAIGLAVFTIVGINIAISKGFADNAFFVIFLGTASGCGGGILRDVFLREIPLIFSKRVYALASVIGGTLYWLLLNFNIVNDASAIILGIVSIFLIRLFAIIFKWNLPHIS